jgi:hypothetical protein
MSRLKPLRKEMVKYLLLFVVRRTLLVFLSIIWDTLNCIVVGFVIAVGERLFTRWMDVISFRGNGTNSCSPEVAVSIYEKGKLIPYWVYRLLLGKSF